MTHTWCLFPLTLDHQSSNPYSFVLDGEKEAVINVPESASCCPKAVLYSLTALGLATHKRGQVQHSIPSLSSAWCSPGSNSWQSEVTDVCMWLLETIRGDLHFFDCRCGCGSRSRHWPWGGFGTRNDTQGKKRGSLIGEGGGELTLSTSGCLPQVSSRCLYSFLIVALANHNKHNLI